MTLTFDSVTANGNGLLVGSIKLRQIRFGNLEADGAVVELTAGLEGIDVAFKSGGDDETSFGHK